MGVATEELALQGGNACVVLQLEIDDLSFHLIACWGRIENFGIGDAAGWDGFQEGIELFARHGGRLAVYHHSYGLCVEGQSFVLLVYARQLFDGFVSIIYWMVLDQLREVVGQCRTLYLDDRAIPLHHYIGE